MKGSMIGLTARPSHLHVADRCLIQIRRIPIARQTTTKIPNAINALIVIPVEHLHQHPLTTGLMLVLGVHDTDRMICIHKLYDVLAYMVGSAGKLMTKGVINPCLQMLATNLSSTNANIRSEQPDMRVEVPHIER